MAEPAGTPASQLLTALRGREAPLSLTISPEGFVTADDCCFDSNHLFGVVFRHPEGDIDIGADGPPRREWLRLELPAASYQQQVERVLEALAQWEPVEDGLRPWAETHGDSKEGLNAWLDEPYCWEGYEPSDDLNEYLPGLLVFGALPQFERKPLGLHVGNIGGPGSGGVLALSVDCSAELLNEAMRASGLPCLITRDHRSPEAGT
jgi:hypothetical protein